MEWDYWVASRWSKRARSIKQAPWTNRKKGVSYGSACEFYADIEKKYFKTNKAEAIRSP